MLTNEKILDSLKAEFAEKVHTPDLQYGLLSVNTDREHIIPVMEFLKNDKELDFIFLTD